MRIYSRPRRAGKTCEAIEYAAKTDSVVVCASESEARRVTDVARALGRNVRAISCHGAHEKLRGNRAGVIVDNADWVLSLFLGKSVDAITVSGPTAEINWSEPERRTTAPQRH